ncbi:MAG: ATP-binding protein [Fretibacterium sp.]|nr:ATP-binding protein [Fretibacterium sp.]
MQRITIKKLGPVDFFDTEMCQHNLFIGEQTSGKSTVAKGIYFCRNYKNILRDALYDVCDTGTCEGKKINGVKEFSLYIRDSVKRLFVDFFGPSWDLDRDLTLRYEFVPEKIWLCFSIEQENGYINFEYSKKLAGEVNTLTSEAINRYRSKYPTQNALGMNSRERIRNQQFIRKELDRIFEDSEETYYIPAGRSLLTLLSGGGPLLYNQPLDYVTRQFLNVIGSIRRYFARGIDGAFELYKTPDTRDTNSYAEAAQRVIHILRANYYFVSNEEYLSVWTKQGGDTKIPLNFASSSQQECLWLLSLLYFLLLLRERAFVIIEEPEAHLYPTRQNDLLKFIAYFVNETGSTVLITTHSPYVLTALNTLYIAGRALETDAKLKEQVEEIIGGNYAIRPGTFQAYKMELDSGPQNLMDIDDQELKTEMIDEVSETIMGNYMKIYHLMQGGDDDAE